MKEKIKIIFLLVLFILVLVGIKIILDKQDESFIQNQTSLENINQNIRQETEEISVENTLEGNRVQEKTVIEVNEEEFETEVLNSDKTVLIDFYADWCNPCKVLSPIVEEVANELEDIKVVKINIDETEEIANKYNIMSIPTLVVIKNGKETNRSVGVISKSNIIELVK